jgi:hypothetical protein
MDLRKWFKKLGKGGPSEDNPLPSSTQASRMGRHGLMPKLPQWATKKDAFITEPPNPKPSAAEPDMAETASIKRPGRWLKEKLGVGKPEEIIQGIEKSKDISPNKKPASDQEIRSFLEDFLTKEHASKKNDPPPIPKK